MNLKRVVYLYMIGLAVASVSCFTLTSHRVFAQGANINVTGADYNVTINQSTPSLSNVTQSVTPRIIVEYTDFFSESPTKPIQGLSLTTAARIIVEYADYASNAFLSFPTGQCIPEYSLAVTLSLMTLMVLAFMRRKRITRTGNA